MTNQEVYEMVTERLLTEMASGKIPWRKPWKDSEGFAAGPRSWSSGKFYRGFNAILLPAGEYLTYNAVRKAGGSVKRGESSWPVIFWKWIESKTEKRTIKKLDGSTEVVPVLIPLLRYYNVFEVSQCENIPRRYASAVPELPASAILDGYKNGPQVMISDRAWYRPAADLVGVPPAETFSSEAEYFSTLYHELVHSTGHASRLGRFSADGTVAAFGGIDYSKEELVAEFGAAFLCRVAGVDNDSSLKNSAAYLAGWMEALKNDSGLAVMAASKAQKAVDLILGVSAADPVESE